MKEGEASLAIWRPISVNRWTSSGDIDFLGRQAQATVVPGLASSGDGLLELGENR